VRIKLSASTKVLQNFKSQAKARIIININIPVDAMIEDITTIGPNEVLIFWSIRIIWLVTSTLIMK